MARGDRAGALPRGWFALAWTDAVPTGTVGLVPEHADSRRSYRTRADGPGATSLEVDRRGLGIGITRNRFSGDLPDSTVLGTVTPIDANRVHVRFSVCFPEPGGSPLRRRRG